MTALLERPPGHPSSPDAQPVPHPRPRPRPGPSRRPLPTSRPTGIDKRTLSSPRMRVQQWLAATWRWRVFLAAATLLTLGARIWRVNSSYDLFIDEPFYTQVGQSVARGGMPYATGSAFFLHPPGFFLAEAGWMRIFGGHTYVFASVFSVRKLVAVIAALTALALGVLVGRVAGRVAAAIVVLLFAVNTFANGQGSLVLLEPITLFWTICGYTVFAHLDTREDDEGEERRHRQVRLAALLFGLACLSKEFAVFVTLVPLMLAFVTKTWLTRRETVRAMIFTCVPWGIWLCVVGANGYWGEFRQQILAGYLRTTGSTQISGFNSANAPSFVDTVIHNLDQLWTAYVVLVLGTVGIAYVFVTSKADPRLRFLSLSGVGAVPLLAYCVLFGTNEEQFFNFLFFPALICLVVGIGAAWKHVGPRLRAAVVVLLVAGAVSDSVQYLIVHLGSDDGTYRLDRWMSENVAAGTTIATTTPVQREIFLRYEMVDDRAGAVLDPAVKYLVVFHAQVDEGYAFVDRTTIDRQTRGKRIVYSTSDRSNGRMVVYAIY